MKRAVLLLLSVLLIGCGSTPWYADVNAFRSDINSWKLIAQGVTIAIAQLESKGFRCVESEGNVAPYSAIYRCYRRASGLVCIQHQTVFLGIDDSATVQKTWNKESDNGELPSACF